MSKKLNLSCVNYRQGNPECNAYYLPYSTGILWSYASNIPEISKNWTLGHHGFKRDPIEEIYKQVADCEVLGLSTYVWNKNYNFALGRRVKQYNPKIKIVLGGPEIAILDKNLFEKIPWADIVVKKEGEFTFASILQNIDSYYDVKGLCINDNGVLLDTGEPDRIKEIDSIPSPYLTGVFDLLIEQNPNITWNAIFETNRGCPYQCTFCDWGSLTYSKVMKFDLHRAEQELAWMSKHKVDYVSVTDANFGMFPDRDNIIVDKLIELQKLTGYPKRFNFSWAKNQKSNVIELITKLFTAGMNNGLTVSTQSMTDIVLENIKRKNLPSNKLAETFDMCNKANIPVTTELIIGLPGETLSSWKNNLITAIELGLHNQIDILFTQLLENAEMNISQREEYKLTTRIVPNFVMGSSQDQDIIEYMEIVTGSKDMPTEDMIQAIMYSWYIFALHVSGAAQWYSRLLNKMHNVSYKDFYDGLENYLNQFEWFKEEREYAQDQITHFLTGDKELDPVTEAVPIDGYNLFYLGIYRLAAYNKQENYLSAVKHYVEHTYSKLLSQELIDDLNRLSNAYMIRANNLTQYPIKLELDHNITGYILNDENLNSFCSLEMNFEYGEMSVDSFVRNIYFYRRRYFGKAEIKRIS